MTGQSSPQPSLQPASGVSRTPGLDAGSGPGNFGNSDGLRELMSRTSLITAENPWLLRLLSLRIGQYVARVS